MRHDVKLERRGEKLLADVRGIIEEARRTVYAGVAAVQLEHNWKIGRRIVEEEQGGKSRAEYAKRTIADLSAHLCAEFGEGYSERSLREYRAFYKVFPDWEILHTRVPNLTWSHFRLLMRVGEPKVREWYMQEASNEGWSVRTLDRNIAISKVENFDLRHGQNNDTTMSGTLSFFAEICFVVVASVAGGKISKVENFDLRRGLERRAA